MAKKKAILRKIVVGEMMANCYIYADPDTKEAFIIDPGAEPDRIRAVIDKYSLKVKSVINTHGHIDHISANRLLGFPIWIHEADADFLQDPQKNLSALFGYELRSPQASKLLKEGEVLKVGNLWLEVIHTPGHTPGSICLGSDGILFSGDLLFAGGIGRSDFPYSSERMLFCSIKEKIMTYDDDTVVYPGHGPTTTIGIEKKNNPFL